MNNSIVIRQARKTDISFISKVISQSWKVAFQEYFSLEKLNQIASEERFFTVIDSVLSCNKGSLRVALIDNELVGEVFWFCDLESSTTEIISLFTLPQVWGNGVGKQLLLQVEKEVQSEVIEIWTFEKNKRARSFYEKMGYELSENVRRSEFDGLLEVKYIKKIKF